MKRLILISCFLASFVFAKHHEPDDPKQAKGFSDVYDQWWGKPQSYFPRLVKCEDGGDFSPGNSWCDQEGNYMIFGSIRLVGTLFSFHDNKLNSVSYEVSPIYNIDDVLQAAIKAHGSPYMMQQLLILFDVVTYYWIDGNTQMSVIVDDSGTILRPNHISVMFRPDPKCHN